MSTSSLYCVLCIFHLGSRGREWRMKMPSKGYKLLLSSLLLLTWWPMHPSLSLSLSHTITHSECAEVMQLQVSTYLRSWLHHSSHHLSRAHPLWTAISFSGNPAEDEPMEKKRQKGRSCLVYVQHHMHMPSLGIQWGKLLYIFIYIYLCFWVIKWKILDEQNESKIYNLLENSASSIWQLRRLQNRLCILKQRRCKILGSC